MNSLNITRLLHYIFPAIIGCLLFHPAAYALSPDHYAANSVLAEGRWVRVSVPSAGMHLISTASLKAMGFNNPEKVNVYGTGGRILSYALDEKTPDDLPLLPSIKTQKGILFYGTDNVTWKADKETIGYSHELNPYSTESWYYLSDREPVSQTGMESVAAPTNNGSVKLPVIGTFAERLLHETEIEAPDESGRDLFGEDFRTQKTQSFPFRLKGLVAEPAYARITFGATSSASTSITIKGNGTTLPATKSYSTSLSTDNKDSMDPVTDKVFATRVKSLKTIEKPEENLNIEITFNEGGIVKFARLDFIEISYTRKLHLEDSFLLFHTNLKSDAIGEISGCSSSTRIWDVTDPCRPVEMKFLLSGDKARIAMSSGYREYVAFNPEQASAMTANWQPVANQDIHSLETPEMVIITHDTYLEGANRIANLHRNTNGMKVTVLEASAIYHEFSGGSADPGAFRKLLKMWYDRGGETPLKYCLLMGRPYYDNRCLTAGAKSIGYKPMPIWGSKDAFSETSSYSTDCYIAMLRDCSENMNFDSAEISIAVGRLPVKSASEANRMASKLEKYVLEPNYGSWRNRVMLIADDIEDYQADNDISVSSIFFDQAEEVRKNLSSTPDGALYSYDRVYLDAHKLEYTGIGPNYPTAKARMMKNFNDGVIYTNYLGHASPTSWTAEKLLEWPDINNFSNKNLTFLFGGTCSFAYWDCSSVSGGELLLLNPTAGTIGMILPSRAVWINENATLNIGLARYLFTRDSEGKPLPVGESYRKALNDHKGSNSWRYCLISDPALRLPLPTRSVEFSSINDTPVSEDSDSFPEIAALSKVAVEGEILNPDGTIDENFNGMLDLTLYDAETVVDTKDMGKGLRRVFNERNSKLTANTVKVSSGRWKATLMLPSEIANNYSPALISAYAWDSKEGNEAHGRCEKLYVYGIDTSAPEDNKAPVISNLYLNSRNFTQGGVVNGSPILFATLSDESGINISDSGIGHLITLCLDGKTTFTDLNLFYTSDPDKEGTGSICYPLEDITPGKHSMTLTVWDNANNSSSAVIDFNVAAALDPVITSLGTNVNPASTSVVFTLTVDRPNSHLECELDVYDLSGRRVWSNHNSVTTDMESSTSMEWDLRDSSGVRVPRGIYLYRATVRTQEGTYSSKTRKLAVTAQ